jgi:hypothetical protein
LGSAGQSSQDRSQIGLRRGAQGGQGVVREHDAGVGEDVPLAVTGRERLADDVHPGVGFVKGDARDRADSVRCSALRRCELNMVSPFFEIVPSPGSTGAAHALVRRPCSP